MCGRFAQYEPRSNLDVLSSYFLPYGIRLAMISSAVQRSQLEGLQGPAESR